MKPVVVNAPAFNETIGGTIVLHYLVDRLRNLGVDAYVYPLFHAREYPKWPRRALKERSIFFLRYLMRCATGPRFQTHPSMNTPVAPKSILADSVVVYPEIVSGNPLDAKHVVRWLLHKPGFFKKDVYFDPDELTFFYQEAFRVGHESVDPDNLLRLRWVRDDIYFDKGLTDRNGACRLVRKGKITGAVIPEDDDTIIVDGLSHEETAEIFNRCKYLYCHDPYTMYSLYAAICGCVPIVMPQPDLSREEWRATYPFKNGIAYGVEEAQWAADTRDDLLREFAEQQRSQEQLVRKFVRKLDAKFHILDRTNAVFACESSTIGGK